MTLFEYLAIAFSLVLSFSVVRVLSGLPFAAAPERRYWVHLVFVSIQLLVAVVAFWNGWGFREATWTLPRFILCLAAPGLIYFNACTLMPENPSSIRSWRNYYYSVRRRFFLGVAAHAVVAVGVTFVLADTPLTHPSRIPVLIGIAGAGLGASSSSTRVHAGLALGFAFMIVLSSATAFFDPGSYAR